MNDLRFEFENAPVRVVATRKIPRIETPGIIIEEVEPNREMAVSLWVAWELVEAGLVRFADGGLSSEELTQIHYRELIPPVGQFAPIPDGLYARAYLTFARLAREARGDEVRTAQLNRLRGMFRDVVESRIGKVHRLASVETSSPPRGLGPEEAALHGELCSVVSAWRSEARRLEAR